MGKTAVQGLDLTAEPGVQEIAITRVFDAPRERVFKAHTDPKLIAQWWGPARYTTIVDTMDARPGGSWRFINRDTDGNEFAFHGVFLEVIEPLLATLADDEAAVQRTRLLGSAADAGLAEAVFQIEAEWETPVVERRLEYPLNGEFEIQAENETRRVALKGKAEAMPAWDVVSAQPARTRFEPPAIFWARAFW